MAKLQQQLGIAEKQVLVTEVASERDRVRVCVCVCERERERERTALFSTIMHEVGCSLDAQLSAAHQTIADMQRDAQQDRKRLSNLEQQIEMLLRLQQQPLDETHAVTTGTTIQSLLGSEVVESGSLPLP